jgi:hypothetical protein
MHSRRTSTQAATTAAATLAAALLLLTSLSTGAADAVTGPGCLQDTCTPPAPGASGAAAADGTVAPVTGAATVGGTFALGSGEPLSRRSPARAVLTFTSPAVLVRIEDPLRSPPHGVTAQKPMRQRLACLRGTVVVERLHHYGDCFLGDADVAQDRQQ